MFEVKQKSQSVCIKGTLGCSTKCCQKRSEWFHESLTLFTLLSPDPTAPAGASTGQPVFQMSFLTLKTLYFSLFLKIIFNNNLTTHFFKLNYTFLLIIDPLIHLSHSIHRNKMLQLIVFSFQLYFEK